MIRSVLKKIDEKISLPLLTKIGATLLILYLLKATTTVWGTWVSTIISILEPFIIGFILAYVISPLIEYLQKKGVPKNISIVIFWLVVIALFSLLILVLLPIIYDKIVAFLGSLVDGVRWVNIKLNVFIHPKEEITIIDSLSATIIKFLQSYENWLPGFVSSLPGFMNTFLNVFTTTLFSIIIAIYMLFDFDRIKVNIKKITHFLSNNNEIYLSRINEDVGVYIKSLLILMFIKFIEYSLFYYLIGHQDWLIVAILTAVGVMVPYLGGTIANGIAILTALTLEPIRIFFLLVGIVVLSNIDAYVISPLIHKKRSYLGPLTTLFSVFAGGVIYGAVGIMISVPLAIAIRSAFYVHAQITDPIKKD
ncbi:MAG: AI-2E family transporter [Erysipelotrichaceae bacterium]